MSISATKKHDTGTQSPKPNFDGLPEAVQSVDEKLVSLAGNQKTIENDTLQLRTDANSIITGQGALFLAIVVFGFLNILGLIVLGAFLKS